MAEQSLNIERLQSQASTLKRQLTYSIHQESNAKAELKVAESRNRALREDMARLKTTVAQIRGQCANDVRKRDNEVKRLKRHLEGRRGRDGTGGQLGVMVITPGDQAANNSSTNNHIAASSGSSVTSLKEDTAAFLTRLSRDLTNENEALIELARNTLATLRNLQGLQEHGTDVIETGSLVQQDPNVVLSIPPTCESLSANMNEVLEHLRSLLTNPSFVPLEEVEIREDEIIRLREGWDKMEARWREAVALMDGWRRRMMETGDTINLDDLRKGLTLDSEEIPKPTPKPANDVSVIKDSNTSVLSVTRESASKTAHADGEVSHLEPDLSSPLKSLDDSPTPLFPPPNILRPTAGNARRRSLSPPKVSFPVPAADGSDQASILDSSDDISLLNFSAVKLPTNEAAPHTGPDRSEVCTFPQPHVSGIPNAVQSSSLALELSVSERLQIAQQDAEAARSRDMNPDVLKAGPASAGIRGRPRRKRGTLSQEELDELLGLI